jgi:hypothetical protein
MAIYLYTRTKRKRAAKLWPWVEITVVGSGGVFVFFGCILV